MEDASVFMGNQEITSSPTPLRPFPPLLCRQLGLPFLEVFLLVRCRDSRRSCQEYVACEVCARAQSVEDDDEAISLGET